MGCTTSKSGKSDGKQKTKSKQKDPITNSGGGGKNGTFERNDKYKYTIPNIFVRINQGKIWQNYNSLQKLG